jgi:general secretion pathway protein D
MAGTEPAYERTRAIVKRLDLALEIEGGQTIHVVPLHAAIAEQLAATLASSLQQGAGSLGSGARPTVDATGGLALEGKVKVLADKPSNKLIVIASGHDYLAMRDMIRELDVPRRQVFIDAQILEVNLSDDTEVGTSMHGALPSSTGTNAIVGGVELPNLSSVNTSTLTSASGLIGGIIGAPIPGLTSLLGQSIPSYAVLFNAVATDSNTNLLSAPSILALDNDEAKFKVGIDVPYKRGTTTSLGVTTSNIDRKELTLELDIKPHISDGDVVMLEVSHDAKDLGETVADGPTWTTRSFQTKLLVRDQQSVAIGGLIQEREVRTITKVPLLGDIPLLGYLFKYDSKVKKKSSLLIVLTPYIIRDQEELERIRSRKQREHDELTRSFATFTHMQFVPGIDYGRKRGLLEDINRVELDIDEEIAERAALPKPVVVDTGLVPLDRPALAR